MKIERIKKSFAAHGIEYCLVSSIGNYHFKKPLVRISFFDITCSSARAVINFCSFSEAYCYCKKHGLLSLSRRVR